MKEISKTLDINGRTLTLSTGKLAKKAESAVVAQIGGTVVLATLCSSKIREDKGYFPLSVEFEERYYAGGRISSSRFIKREGRPSEHAILSGRAIDRSIRPLFPAGLDREVQIIITTLSLDHVTDPAWLGMIAASAAITSSTLPWQGPIAGIKVGLVDDKLVINPTETELETSPLDLMVVSTKDGVTMLEGEGKEVADDMFKQAIKAGYDAAAPILDIINDFASTVNKKKIELPAKDTELEAQKEEIAAYIKKNYIPQLEDPEFVKDLEHEWEDQCVEELKAEFAEKELLGGIFQEVFEEEFRNFVRNRILDSGKRIDGRTFDEIRELAIEVGLLPRTHGSALFQRGATQVMTIATLGSLSLEQTIETMEGEKTKRYMHYYNFPPYSNGEVKRLGSTGRREIGHGALAEKALVPVLPAEEKFPYAMRLVSEVLSSAGSTSQASICGSTLALMDAGVPISAPVAGVAMGLVTSEEWKGANPKQYEIITDIAYTEDANGDMDFKLAGTEKGMTAIQMDIKLPFVPVAILQEITDHAVKARGVLLGAMKKVIDTPRTELSEFAPRFAIVQIDPSQIGQVIGSGGKVINNIIAVTGAQIDIEDDGRVLITGEPAHVDAAKEMVEAIVKEFQPGEIYDGTVTRLMPFGAFVEVLPGREGLVHISQISPQRVETVEDVLSVGQKLKVRVVEVDREGRLNLSARFGADANDQPRGDRRGFGDRGGHDRFNRGHGGRNDDRRRR